LNSKSSIRQEIRAQRRQLPELDRLYAASAVLTQLRRIPVFLKARNISVYLANDGELSLDQVVDSIWQRKKRAYLPVLFGRKSRIMHFARFHEKTIFKLNRFGILEPNIKIKRQLKPHQLDLVLMPLVAFDINGNRIGMGGGFYDKTFSYLRNRNSWRKPKLIGIAYDFQEVESLPDDPWDIPLDFIVTESRSIKVDKKQCSIG